MGEALYARGLHRGDPLPGAGPSRRERPHRPGAEARTLYEKLSTRKHLKIFTAEEGGAEHCQVDNRPMGMDYIADWLVETWGLPPR